MTYKGKASYGSSTLSIYNSKASCIWLEYLYVTRIFIFDSNIYMWLECFIWTRYVSYEHIYLTRKFRMNTIHLTRLLDLNIYIWLEYLYLTRIFIFDSSVHIWFEYLYVSRVFTFDSNIHIWSKCLCLTRMFIFDSNIHNWLEYLYLTRILMFDLKSIFDSNMYTWCDSNVSYGPNMFHMNTYIYPDIFHMNTMYLTQMLCVRVSRWPSPIECF